MFLFTLFYGPIHNVITTNYYMNIITLISRKICERYRISHGLWCDTIFIQRVVYFLSPSLGKGIKNTSWIKIISQNMGDSFYHIFTTPYLFFLTSFFGRRSVGIHNVISKNYHRVLSHWYQGKYRWLSITRTSISRSSWSLEVKSWSRFFSLYN
jgi:hypothetical protein